MASKRSAALLAAMIAIAGPAFAQDAKVPSTLPENMDAATTEAADAINNAAGATAEAAGDAANAAADAVTEAAEEAQAATGAEAPAGDATADAATEGATATEPTAPATDAPATSAGTADAAAPADAAPAAAPTEAAAPAAPAEPQPGAYYVKTTHTDWTIRCIKAAQGADPCELYQLLKDEAGNSVAEVTMIPLEGDVAAGATMVAPLETDLMKGIGLKIDSAAARGYPFNFCAPVGCVSRMGFTPAELSALKRGNQATVTLLPFGADPNQPVNLAMSLSGFTAAFDDLTTIAAEARAANAAAAAAAEAPPAAEAAPEAEAGAETAPSN